jgi:MFS family permease
MLSSYGRILRVPGGWRMSLAGLAGRLPISMMSLGIVLLVQAATGSYGLAGAVSAVYVVANAAFSILQGRLLDRLGQSRVLLPLVLVYAGATGLLVASVTAGWSPWLVWPLAAVAGAGLPTMGTCVRARWSHVLHDRPADLQTAFALEAVVDETVFILGPILVTVLATTVHPAVGLGTAVVAALVGTLALVAQRGTEPPPAPQRTRAAGRPPLPWRTLLPLLGVQASLGCLFGAAEVVTVAFADEQGSRALAGPLLALWALGSLLAGVITGAVAWQRGPDVRVRLGAIGMGLAMAPLPLIGSFPVMALVLLLGGFAIAPTLIASTSLVERTVPPTRLTEGMAMLHTGVVAGIAPGAALAGAVVDSSGAGGGYLVMVGGGVAAALVAQLLPRTARDRDPAVAP